MNGLLVPPVLATARAWRTSAAWRQFFPLILAGGILPGLGIGSASGGDVGGMASRENDEMPVSDEAVAGARVPEADAWCVERRRMVDELATVEGIRSERVLAALRETPRHEFVSERWRPWAYFDMALPIGQAQTATPPSLVAQMTEQLDVQPHHRVLEVGTGCGYQAAILSRLAKAVYTVEIVGSLGRQARATLRRLACTNVQVRIGDGFRGWPEMAPFDRILVTCSPEAVPAPLLAQLAEGGRLIIPLGAPYQQNLYRFTKSDGKLVREVLGPTVFVPMTGEAAARHTRKADPRRPTLVNGGFEQVDPDTGELAGWYHQRQLIREELADVPQGKVCITFRNGQAGRTAHAAQVLAIDGRRLRTMKVAGWVKGEDIRPGDGAHQIATVVVAFYDHDRAPLGQETIGDWRGTSGWRAFAGEVDVPKAAREAILLIGLHGATGSLSFAGLRLETDSPQVSTTPRRE